MQKNWPLKQSVSVGGPVHDDSLFYLHRMGDVVSGGMPVLPGLWLGGDFDELKAGLASGRYGDQDVRFFVGYSGWTPGQLDAEMRERSWYVPRCSTGGQVECYFRPPGGRALAFDAGLKGAWPCPGDHAAVGPELELTALRITQNPIGSCIQNGGAH